mgnify:CR=1 FL=1
MKKSVLVCDSNEKNSQNIISINDVDIHWMDDTMQVMLLVAQPEYQEQDIHIIINPKMPTILGYPSTINLVQYLRTAHPKIKLFYLYDSEEQLKLVTKHTKSNVTGHISRPLTAEKILSVLGESVLDTKKPEAIKTSGSPENCLI